MKIVGGDNQVQTIFTAIQSGIGQINAYLLGQTANVPIKVSHGQLHDITIDPFIAYLPVSSGQEQFQYQFIGHGWDLGKNPIGDIPIQWTVDQAAGSIDPTGLMKSINQVLGKTATVVHIKTRDLVLLWKFKSLLLLIIGWMNCCQLVSFNLSLYHLSKNICYH